LIAEEHLRFSETHPASYSTGTGAVSWEADRSGSVLQLMLNSVGIFTDKIVSEMDIRHGKKRKNGLRANGMYSFAKSGDFLIVQSNTLKMGMNN